MKVIRYLLIAVVSLVVLAAVAIGVAVFVIDPNTYKPEIEAVVEKNTNLDLELNGEIDWSIIPLGLELNDVKASLNNEPFVSLQQMVAQVNFWSLLSMSPEVDTFSLSGLKANLVKNEDGTGNWSQVMPEKTEAETAATPEAAATPAETTDTADGESKPLNFNVDQVLISDAQIEYTDQATGQKVVLNNFGLSASSITLGSEFPFEVNFDVALGKPATEVNGQIKARLSADEALNAFTVAGLQSQFKISGEPLKGKSVQAGVSGDLRADLETETANLENIRTTLANFELVTSVMVEGFGDKPRLSGSMKTNEFSLRQLLTALGQDAPATTDPEVLQALSFSSDIGGPEGTVELKNVKIKLDDTTFAGNARYGLENSAIGLKLKGDDLDVDRYLPPSPTDEAKPASTTASSDPNADLLPLETIRDLILDLDVGLENLKVANLSIRELEGVVKARGGKVDVNPIKGEMYYGKFNLTAALDARPNVPTWTIKQTMNGVQTQPLLMDLAETDLLKGAMNLTADIKTKGNQIPVLRQNASGNIRFNLAEGEFTRMNLTRMACTGIALANGEALSTDDWGTGTPFDDMSAELTIDGYTLNNNSLVAQLAGLELSGDGKVFTDKNTVDYKMALRVVGELHRDNACRVTEYVQSAVIPVECKGNYVENPAGLCSFDGSRFRDTLTAMAKKAGTAKAQKELNRAIDNKLGNKLEEKLGEDTGKNVKDALKGLLNR